MAKRTDAERAEAIARLREWCKPGDTLHTVLRGVARNGMSRRIDVYKLDAGDASYLTGWVATAVGFRRAKEGPLVIGGCGMDMGFHVVSTLSRVLYPSGFGCIGERKGHVCPSNDHTNGDRDYTPHWRAKPRPCPAHPEATPAGDRVCGGCLNDESPERALSVVWYRNSSHAFYVCRPCLDAGYLESHHWVRETPPDCRTCDGSGRLAKGHWHRSGAYALRHRWL